MDAVQVYDLLKKACLELEESGEYAVAAFVGHAMTLLEERYALVPPPGSDTGD
jgi:hypothetical protein